MIMRIGISNEIPRPRIEERRAFRGLKLLVHGLLEKRGATGCPLIYAQQRLFTTCTASQLLRSGREQTSKVAPCCRRYISFNLIGLSLHRTSDGLQIKLEAGWRWPTRRAKADLRRGGAVIRVVVRTHS